MRTRLRRHVKGEWPHLDAIDDPAVLRAELERVRPHYNTVWLSPPGGTAPAEYARQWTINQLALP